MHSNRLLVLLLATAVCGCDVEVKVKVGNTDNKSHKAWAPYATSKRTQNYEYWWASFESRDECLRTVKHGVSNTVNATWYAEPVGCMYLGSDNRYVLYAVNKFLNRDAFGCVAEIFDAPGEQYSVILKGNRTEAENFRCVMF